MQAESLSAATAGVGRISRFCGPPWQQPWPVAALSGCPCPPYLWRRSERQTLSYATDVTASSSEEINSWPARNIPETKPVSDQSRRNEGNSHEHDCRNRFESQGQRGASRC
jgi:hypothetical protein